MSKKTSMDSQRADRFVSEEGSFTQHRAKGKKPLPGVQRQTTLDKARRTQTVPAVPLATPRQKEE